MKEIFLENKKNETTAELLEPVLRSIKQKALSLIKPTEDKDWLISSLRESSHIENIVAQMAHVDGGQEFVLQELVKEAPELRWYRGGTLRKFRDSISQNNFQYFSPEQLETFVIDGGANGVLGRKELAVAYLEKTPRDHPVLYTVSLEEMLTGLKAKAIRLVTEHGYDLRIIEGEDRKAYIGFCRKHLNIEEVN